MATLETEIRVANLLLSLGQAEQSLEQAREKLAQHRMFDPLLLFRLLDPQDSGMATFTNLKRFMA